VTPRRPRKRDKKEGLNARRSCNERRRIFKQERAGKRAMARTRGFVAPATGFESLTIYSIQKSYVLRWMIIHLLRIILRSTIQAQMMWFWAQQVFHFTYFAEEREAERKRKREKVDFTRGTEKEVFGW